MPEYMKAVDVRGGRGGPEALFINDHVPKPTPNPGQALVQVKAFGLNRMDLLQREGMYPAPPGISNIMGVEFSGIVVELGEDNDSTESDPPRFAIGDAVFGLAYGGAYAEFVTTSALTLIHKPAFLSWQQAAGLPETWMTALQALHQVGGFQKGETALWHAGASGVSIAGIQLARLAGAKKVFATAGSDAKCAFVVDELGATAAFNYKTTDWAKELGDDNKINLTIDYIGAPYFQRNLDVAALDGRIVLLAFLGGAVLPSGINIAPLLRKRLRIEGSSLRSRDPAYQGKLRDRLADVLPHFADGTLKLFVDRVFDWTEIRAAHEYMAKDVSMGKIICTIP